MKGLPDGSQTPEGKRKGTYLISVNESGRNTPRVLEVNAWVYVLHRGPGLIAAYGISVGFVVLIFIGLLWLYQQALL